MADRVFRLGSRWDASLRRTLRKLAGVTGGLTLVVIGLPVFVTPIPLGTPLIALGLFLLLRTSSWARLLRRRLARRYPETARRLDATRAVLTDSVQRIRRVLSGRPRRR